MTPELVQHCGDELYPARHQRRVHRALLECLPAISTAGAYAYAVARRMVARRAHAGEAIVGKTVGATSKPVQDSSQPPRLPVSDGDQRVRTIGGLGNGRAHVDGQARIA